MQNAFLIHINSFICSLPFHNFIHSIHQSKDPNITSARSLRPRAISPTRTTQMPMQKSTRLLQGDVFVNGPRQRGLRGPSSSLGRARREKTNMRDESAFFYFLYVLSRCFAFVRHARNILDSDSVIHSHNFLIPKLFLYE